MKKTIFIAFLLASTCANAQVRYSAPPRTTGDYVIVDSIMLSAKDLAVGISWDSAKNICTNYTGGGFTDWRLPTMAELRKIYAYAKPTEQEFRLQNYFMKGNYWSADESGTKAAWTKLFWFYNDGDVERKNSKSNPDIYKDMSVRAVRTIK